LSSIGFKVCQKTLNLFGQFGGLGTAVHFAELGSFASDGLIQKGSATGQFVNIFRQPLNSNIHVVWIDRPGVPDEFVDR